MKPGYSEIRIEKIEQKLIENDFEAGSGGLTIPILANLFPSLFHQEMKQIEKYIFVIKGKKYFVDKEMYTKYNNEDQINVLYRIKDNIILTIGI